MLTHNVSQEIMCDILALWKKIHSLVRNKGFSHNFGISCKMKEIADSFFFFFRY